MFVLVCSRRRRLHDILCAETRVAALFANDCLLNSTTKSLLETLGVSLNKTDKSAMNFPFEVIKMDVIEDITDEE